MTWEDKNKKSQCTKMVVTVSNWHFNRNTLKLDKAPTCKLEDVMVTLKLSSTVFFENEGGTPVVATAANEPDTTLPTSPGAAAAANSDGGAVQHSNGESYFFDRNGAIIPYSAFVALLDSEKFDDYLQALYKLREGKAYQAPITVPDDTDEDDDDDDEVNVDDPLVCDKEEEEFLRAAKKRKRSDFVKGMRGGKSKKVIQFVDDDDDEEDDEVADLGVTPLPSEHDEEEEEAVIATQTQNWSTEETPDKEKKEKDDDKQAEKKEGRKTRKK
jgi:hypothetical protein